MRAPAPPHNRMHADCNPTLHGHVQARWPVDTLASTQATCHVYCLFNLQGAHTTHYTHIYMVELLAGDSSTQQTVGTVQIWTIWESSLDQCSPCPAQRQNRWTERSPAKMSRVPERLRDPRKKIWNTRDKFQSSHPHCVPRNRPLRSPTSRRPRPITESTACLCRAAIASSWV